MFFVVCLILIGLVPVKFLCYRRVKITNEIPIMITVGSNQVIVSSENHRPDQFGILHLIEDFTNIGKVFFELYEMNVGFQTPLYEPGNKIKQTRKAADSKF